MIAYNENNNSMKGILDMKKMNNIINKLLIPLCGTGCSCIFIANASQTYA